MRIGRKRGIFLISVLFIITLIAMFVGAAFELAPGALRRTVNTAELTVAQRTARSGVAYALAKLKADPTWRGTGNAVTVNEPDLVIVEREGNVVGLLTQNGITSQFRLRFNYQDGAGGLDGLNDPTGLTLNLPLVSCNNLPGNVERPVPKADGPGHSVTSGSLTHTVLPAHSVYLACEGRAGDWLRSATAANPDPAVPTFGSVTSAQVETVYKVTNIGQNVVASAASSAGPFAADLAPPDGTDRNELTLDSSTSNTMGRLRSRDNLAISGGETTGENFKAPLSGEYRIRSGFSFTNPGTTSATIAAATEGESDELYKIEWSDVRRAVPAAGNQLAAGVYTVSQDGQLHYYNTDLAGYRALMLADPTNAGVVPAVLPGTVSYSVTNAGSATMEARLTVTGDTSVTPVGTFKDLVIIPQKGADAGPGAPGSGAFPQATVESKFTSNQTFSGNPLVNWDGSKFEYSNSVGALLNAVAAYHGRTSGTWTMGTLTMSNIGSSTNVLDGPGSIVSSSISIKSNMIPKIMSYITANPSSPLVTTALTELGITAGSGGELTDIAPVTDTTVPANLSIQFAPAGASSAVLSGEGDVTLGAKVQGEGGSITSEGNLNLVGLGVGLSAAANPNEGVSLYSKKDILISTYDKGNTRYNDVGLKGVVYAWGNIKAVLGHSGLTNGADWGDFKLTGALVAYGKDPSDTSGPILNGNIDIKAERADLKFDSSYLLSVMASLPDGIQLGRSWWNQH